MSGIKNTHDLNASYVDGDLVMDDDGGVGVIVDSGGRRMPLIIPETHHISKPNFIPWGQPPKPKTIEYAEGDVLKVGDDEVPIKDIINLVKMLKEKPEFSSAFI